MTEEEKNRILAQMDRADWALRCLADGKHKHLERLLCSIQADFRVITDLAPFDLTAADSLDENEALAASQEIGTIRYSHNGGKPHYTVYSVPDLSESHSSLLAKSLQSFLGAVFIAIGLSIEPALPSSSSTKSPFS